MGWSRGSHLAARIIDAFEDLMMEYDPEGNIIDFEGEIEFVDKVIDAFEEMDCDTLGELAGMSDAVDHVLSERGYFEMEE